MLPAAPSQKASDRPKVSPRDREDAAAGTSGGGSSAGSGTDLAARRSSASPLRLRSSLALTGSGAGGAVSASGAGLLRHSTSSLPTEGQATSRGAAVRSALAGALATLQSPKKDIKQEARGPVSGTSAFDSLRSADTEASGSPAHSGSIGAVSLAGGVGQEHTTITFRAFGNSSGSSRVSTPASTFSFGRSREEPAVDLGATPMLMPRRPMLEQQHGAATLARAASAGTAIGVTPQPRVVAPLPLPTQGPLRSYATLGASAGAAALSPSRSAPTSPLRGASASAGEGGGSQSPSRRYQAGEEEGQRARYGGPKALASTAAGAAALRASTSNDGPTAFRMPRNLWEGVAAMPSTAPGPTLTEGGTGSGSGAGRGAGGGPSKLQSMLPGLLASSSDEEDGGEPDGPWRAGRGRAAAGRSRGSTQDEEKLVGLDQVRSTMQRLEQLDALEQARARSRSISPAGSHSSPPRPRSPPEQAGAMLLLLWTCARAA